MKSIVFVPSNENHVEIFWSVCKHMKDYRPVFVSQDFLKNEGAEKKLQQLGISFIGLQDHGGNPATILRNEDPGAVIVANDKDVIPQWFVNCANEMRIPTILMQDGILFDFKTRNNRFAVLRSSNFKLLFTAFRLLILGKYRMTRYGDAGCTRILAWGESSKSYLVAKGINEKKIVVTGSIVSHAVRGSENGTATQTILYIPTDLVHSNIVDRNYASRIINEACSSILSSGNVKLIVKPHPREDSSLYEHITKKYGPALTVSYDNPYNLIRKASIVVTDLSTIAAEALAARKPVVIFMPEIESIVSRSSFPRDLISAKAVLYAGNEQELRHQISGLLNGMILPSKQAIEETAERYFGSFQDPSKSSAEAIRAILR